MKESAFLKQNIFFLNKCSSNQDRAIILAPLRFSCQEGLNDISFDSVRSTSKFDLRACMGQGDPSNLSNILHLEHGVP